MHTYYMKHQAKTPISKALVYLVKESIQMCRNVTRMSEDILFIQKKILPL